MYRQKKSLAYYVKKTLIIFLWLLFSPIVLPIIVVKLADYAYDKYSDADTIYQVIFSPLYGIFLVFLVIMYIIFFILFPYFVIMVIYSIKKSKHNNYDSHQQYMDDKFFVHDQLFRMENEQRDNQRNWNY